ncbi:MAG: hypothetical protein O7C56_03815 [Rickettsia endosymbiont of Ixodes persulcatus]|nr:hypothetical protein [Rickettsia endosymbiont of Ixodes persulcatus]
MKETLNLTPQRTKKVREDVSIGSTYKFTFGGYTRDLIKPVIMAGGNGKRPWPLSSLDSCLSI